jgi:hypothetical protein
MAASPSCWVVALLALLLMCDYEWVNYQVSAIPAFQTAYSATLQTRDYGVCILSRTSSLHPTCPLLVCAMHG